MKAPTTRASSSTEQTTTPASDALAVDTEATFQIEGDTQQGQKSGYSILLRGDIESSSILSSSDPRETVTLLENDTKLLSGSVRGETAGFVLHGTIVAAEFDDPEPTIKLDGTVVDPGRWPTVKEYTRYGANQEPVEEPFPNSGELGKPLGDPLDPREYVIDIDADGDETTAYCFDVDGEVIDHPEGATVAADGDRVYGYLRPGWTKSIEIRGIITRIETGDGIDFVVRERN